MHGAEEVEAEARKLASELEDSYKFLDNSFRALDGSFKGLARMKAFEDLQNDDFFNPNDLSGLIQNLNLLLLEEEIVLVRKEREKYLTQWDKFEELLERCKEVGYKVIDLSEPAAGPSRSNPEIKGLCANLAAFETAYVKLFHGLLEEDDHERALEHYLKVKVSKQRGDKIEPDRIRIKVNDFFGYKSFFRSRQETAMAELKEAIDGLKSELRSSGRSRDAASTALLLAHGLS